MGSKTTSVPIAQLAIVGAWAAPQGEFGARAAGAGYQLYKNFSTNQVWDAKRYIRSKFAYSAADDARKWIAPTDGVSIRADAFGNINYGVMLAIYGVDKDLAVEVANSGGAAGVPDDDDDSAIKLGYQMVADNPGGLSANGYLQYIISHSEEAAWRRGE